MHLDGLADRSPEEVAEIWLQYHEGEQGKQRAGSVLTKQEFQKLSTRGKESPMFVIPLKRGAAGYEVFLTQVQLPYVLITSLEEYKKGGAAAPPHVVATHYTELQDSKGVVLVRGDIVNEKGVTRQEVRTLLELTRAFYCSGDDDYAPVRTFNKHPGQFDFGALLRQLNISTPAAAAAPAAAPPAS